MGVKALFTPLEVNISNSKVTLNDPLAYGDSADITDDIVAEAKAEEKKGDDAPVLPPEEEYRGPTIAELQKEADDFKANWEIEKQKMMDEAHAEAERIVNDARSSADSSRQAEEESAAGLKKAAQEEAQRIVDEATARAGDLTKDAEDAVKKDRDQAREEGKKEGREEAWKQGQDEAVRLVERLRNVLEKTQTIRDEVLSNTENQVVQLSLIVARKVIHTLADNQAGVVIDTVKEALSKVKGRGKVVVRVNTADMNLTTKHKEDFVKMLEGVDGVEVQEDSTIGVGGCVVQTDFGEIDARIESQINELQDRIMTLSPIKGKA